MVSGLRSLVLRLIFLAAMALAPASPSSAQGRENLQTLAVEGDWSILKRPSGACLAVPTDMAASPLSLVVAAGPAAVIYTPFEAGIGGFVILKVDRSNPLYIMARSIPDPGRIDVPSDLIPEMWAGRRLMLEIDPLDRDPENHEFSLTGLSAAVSWLDKPRCRARSQSTEQ